MAHIWVINKRNNNELDPDVLVVPADRSSRVFGNHEFSMRARTPQERTRAINGFKVKYQADMIAHGAIYKESERLANILLSGTDIALECWCSPLPCHADMIADGIKKLYSQKLTDQKPESK